MEFSYKWRLNEKVWMEDYRLVFSLGSRVRRASWLKVHLGSERLSEFGQIYCNLRTVVLWTVGEGRLLSGIIADSVVNCQRARRQ